MRYRLRTLLIVFFIGLPGMSVYAQRIPVADAQKDRTRSYYEQLLLKGVHPLEAQIRDDLLHTRLIWDRPKDAFLRLDELEKELVALQSDADSVRQVIARARNLIQEERTALEVNSTQLEDWAKRLEENPSDAATMNKYVRKAKNLFGFRGNARANTYSAKGLAQVQSLLEKLEQQVTDEDVKKLYATKKAELARIERAITRNAKDSAPK